MGLLSIEPSSVKRCGRSDYSSALGTGLPPSEGPLAPRSISSGLCSILDIIGGCYGVSYGSFSKDVVDVGAALATLLFLWLTFLSVFALILLTGNFIALDE